VSHVHALFGYKSGGKMPVEGNPDEAGQAGMQMSIHVEGGAAIVGPTRGRSSPHPLSDST
jgi:hypothetical protein